MHDAGDPTPGIGGRLEASLAIDAPGASLAGDFAIEVNTTGALFDEELQVGTDTVSLVLDPGTVRAAYHGIVLNDQELKSFALEYLEQVLPPDVRDRLWPFIGDMSASAERRALRGLDDVVADLLQTGATLFGSPEDREALRRYLDDAADDET